jgi:hypothetical protein
LLETEELKKKIGLEYHATAQEVSSIVATRQLKQEELESKRREWAAQAKDIPADALGPGPTSWLEEDGLLPSVKAMNQINLDVDRTFYTHCLFTEKTGRGQTQLRRILSVYARINPDTGYCQGMAYIGAVLLMCMDEEQAFWAFTALMEGPRYFQHYYAEDLRLVQVKVACMVLVFLRTHLLTRQHDSRVFSAILALRHPDLFCHFGEMDVHPLMYVTPWFMCAFTALPLWDSTLAIWDMILWTDRKALLRVGISIIDACKADLLAVTNLGELLPYLQHLPAEKVTSPKCAPSRPACERVVRADHVEHV